MSSLRFYLRKAGKQRVLIVKALLDTHILLFWFENERRLSKGQRKILSSATPEDPLLVCDISLWEICTLYELGRIELAIPLREWLERVTAPPVVQIFSITPPFS